MEEQRICSKHKEMLNEFAKIIDCETRAPKNLPLNNLEIASLLTYMYYYYK